MKKIGNVTYSLAFKVLLFLVLGISFAVGTLCVLGGAYLLEMEAYNRTEDEYLYEALKPIAYRHMNGYIFDDARYPGYYEIRQAVQEESQEYGVWYSIAREGQVVYSNLRDQTTPYAYACSLTRKNSADNSVEEYELTLYVDPHFPKADEFRLTYSTAGWLYFYKIELILVAGVSFLLFLTSFIWLLCNAGRRRGQEGVTPGVLARVPVEILLAVFVIGASMPIFAVAEYNQYSLRMEFTDLPGVLALGVFEVVWFTAFCREYVLRMKLGMRNSLICKGIQMIGRGMKAVGRGLRLLFRGIPMVLPVAAVIVCLTGCELMGLLIWGEAELFVCWLIEKLITIPLILYCAISFEQLQAGGRALAEGDMSYKLDTKNLYLDFKRHGEDLNRIGDGIAKAVEQRMRSERLKTELITNVSHDIKTPLTSVINYADLLGSEAGREDSTLDRAKVAEYSEVLVRQSKRLKKLLDDLLEASKATTGSLEVNPAPCELGVLLTQAVGEYEARFAKKNLLLHIRQPEEEIRIMADGRHLWRVFDNLLNNICKYAQEDTRVYLDMEKKGERAEITFRNMSKYELNVTAEELEERFVRGDKSRNMEGNGLGLSIAKSLVELQNGTMQIVTDGDLFKVIVSFPLLDDGGIRDITGRRDVPTES